MLGHFVEVRVRMEAAAGLTKRVIAQPEIGGVREPGLTADQCLGRLDPVTSGSSTFLKTI